jgi:hypothetical protein
MDDNSFKVSLGGVITSGATLIGGTAGILIWVFTQYIIPLQISSYTQKNSELDKQVLELKGESSARASSIVDLESKLANALSKMAENEKNYVHRIRTLESKGLFIVGDPYPFLLGKVKLGDPIGKLKDVYPVESVSASDGDVVRPYFIVNDVSSVFSRITYFYDKKSNNVTSVSFRLNDELAQYKDFIVDRASEALGKPYRSSVRAAYRWEYSKTVSAYIILGDTYQLMSNDYVPVIWED